MPLEKMPAKAFPVPSGVPYKVSDGEDWYSVAKKFGINVQYLINYNFGTLNTREVNWYLRTRVGCKHASPKGWNWKFSSDARPGTIRIPPVDRSNPKFSSNARSGPIHTTPVDRSSPIITLHRYTYSIATLSWIDPKTGLPEVDVGSPGETILRERILGNSGYRFANFLEATVEVVNTSSGPAPMVFSHIGYSADSGLYRAPSFLGFPSYPYPIQLAKPVQVQGGVEFRQTVGARTQSAELAAGKIPVGGAIGGSIAQKLANFPPIWTELKLTIFYDGTFEGELMAHSLFPSVSYYENSKIICLKTGPTMSGCQAYERKSEYDGNPNLDRWFRQDKGWGARKGFTPAEGNPWGVTEPDRNVIFGQQPPNPNEEVRRPREYPSETWRPSGR